MKLGHQLVSVPHPSFDPEKDLIPVFLGWEAPLVAVFPAKHVSAKTLPEFIAWATKRQDGIAFGSTGIGTTVYLSGEMLCRRTGIQGIHIPFSDGSLTGLLRGDIQLTVDNLPTALTNLRGGKLRALAVTSTERSPDPPDVPTMAEAGIADFMVTSWNALGGIVAPSTGSTDPAGTHGLRIQNSGCGTLCGRNAGGRPWPSMCQALEGTAPRPGQEPPVHRA
nr:tripartite tricarboxylate transporter substrate-binding protein [Pseudoroseomonas vastitatis]